MKHLLRALAALVALAGLAIAHTSGTWMSPISGQPVDITVNGSGANTTVTITHNGTTVTVDAIPGSRPGTAVEYGPVEVGGVSFGARIPGGQPRCSEEPQGRPWFTMPRLVPKDAGDAAHGDGEGTLPRVGA